MGSKKRSAWQKQKAEFAASLGGMDDLFASENARSQRHDEEREAAHRRKSCERKNRYASRYEAELTAAECAEHGAPPLHVYHCPYCNGWHLTSKGEQDCGHRRVFRRVSHLSQSFATFAKGRGGGCCTVIPFFGQRGGLSVWRVGS